MEIFGEKKTLIKKITDQELPFYEKIIREAEETTAQLRLLVEQHKLSLERDEDVLATTSDPAEIEKVATAIGGKRMVLKTLQAKLAQREHYAPGSDPKIMNHHPSNAGLVDALQQADKLDFLAVVYALAPAAREAQKRLARIDADKAAAQTLLVAVCKSRGGFQEENYRFGIPSYEQNRIREALDIIVRLTDEKEEDDGNAQHV